MAVVQERLRFARDLHDLLGHSLSLIVLKSELAGRLLATDPARDSGTAAEIAARLYLLEGTVRNHLSAAIRKPGAHPAGGAADRRGQGLAVGSPSRRSAGGARRQRGAGQQPGAPAGGPALVTA